MRTALKSLLTAAIVLSPLPLAAQDPTEVTLWHMEQPPHRVARIQELIDAFNAANPDVVVKQEPQNWGEIYAKAPAAVAAGAGPDMLFAIPDFAPIFKDLGQLDSVADFVAELDAKHDFVDSAVEAYTYDDGIWAVPMYNMTMHMWYRPSVLEAAGVAVPTTWDEWKAAAEKLTVDGEFGMGWPAMRLTRTPRPRAMKRRLRRQGGSVCKCWASGGTAMSPLMSRRLPLQPGPASRL